MRPDDIMRFTVSISPHDAQQESAAPAAIEKRMNTQSLSTPSGTTSVFPPGAAHPVRVEMVFRIWAPARDPEARGPAQSVAHHPGVLALIEDAAASKQGVFHAADGQLFVSGLNGPADALVISRQIQLGLQGFRGKPGACPVAVSIAIDAGGDQASTAFSGAGADAQRAGPAGGSSSPAGKTAEPSHDLLTLLKLAKPAQILLTHDLWRRIAAIKGLPLKSFPGRFGVYEYLWIAEEKLDLLQSEPQLTLVVLPAALPAASGDLSLASELAPAKDPPTATSAPGSPSVTPAAEKPLTSTAERKAHTFRLPRPVLVAGISVAACAILVAGLSIGHFFSPQGPKSSAPASVQGPVQPPAATPTAPAHTSANPAETAAPPRFTRKSSRDSTASAKTAKPKPGKPAAVVEENPVPPPAPSPGCAFAGDTKRLASLGEQNRERGDYANAERIFRQVLACDPDNAAAREGLNRTIEGEQQGRSRP